MKVTMIKKMRLLADEMMSTLPPAFLLNFSGKSVIQSLRRGWVVEGMPYSVPHVPQVPQVPQLPQTPQQGIQGKAVRATYRIS